MFVHGKYFYGNEVSEYGQEHGYVDYHTLSKAFDCVMQNDIITKTNGVIGYWEQESGFIDNSEEIEELKEMVAELEEQAELAELEEQDNYDKKIDELAERIEKLEEEQDSMDEIFQCFIVSDNGAEILKEINEIVFYNEELDMYVWGVTHWGTSWDYVLTNIKCNVPYEDKAEE